MICPTNVITEYLFVCYIDVTVLYTPKFSINVTFRDKEPEMKILYSNKINSTINFTKGLCLEGTYFVTAYIANTSVSSNQTITATDRNYISYYEYFHN